MTTTGCGPEPAGRVSQAAHRVPWELKVVVWVMKPPIRTMYVLYITYDVRVNRRRMGASTLLGFRYRRGRAGNRRPRRPGRVEHAFVGDRPGDRSDDALQLRPGSRR